MADLEALRAAKHDIGEAIEAYFALLSDKREGVLSAWLIVLEHSRIDDTKADDLVSRYDWLASSGTSYHSAIGLARTGEKLMDEIPAADAEDDEEADGEEA